MCTIDFSQGAGCTRPQQSQSSPRYACRQARSHGEKVGHLFSGGSRCLGLGFGPALPVERSLPAGDAASGLLLCLGGGCAKGVVSLVPTTFALKLQAWLGAALPVMRSMPAVLKHVQLLHREA